MSKHLTPQGGMKCRFCTYRTKDPGALNRILLHAEVEHTAECKLDERFCVNNSVDDLLAYNYFEFVDELIAKESS